METAIERYRILILFLVVTTVFLMISFQLSRTTPHSYFAKEILPKNIVVEGKKPRMNVLLLIADDMRAEIGAFLDSKKRPWLNGDISTPNLDALASRSLVLKQAYVQVAVCNPSRTSFLTSRRPDTTHVYKRELFRQTVASKVVTLPQYFREHGYSTFASGKIFHLIYGFVQDLKYSWTFLNSSIPRPLGADHLASWIAVSDQQRQVQPLMDETYTTRALSLLETLSTDYKKHNKHFFLALGLRKPHLPFVCPEKFFKGYPKTKISRPKNGFCPYKMADEANTQSPEILNWGDTSKYRENWRTNSTFPVDKEKELRRAYYSCVTYTDHNFGLVLDRLDELGLRNSTVVAFLGDHGWHLGENGQWGKCTIFEAAVHSPMMLSVPGLTDQGLETNKLVEFVDLFPSIVEAAGLPIVPQCPRSNSTDVPLCTEGSSLMRLIDNPRTSHWKKRVFSQFPYPSRGDFRYMGYSMRTSKYRYNEWVNFTVGGPKLWPKAHSAELYDMEEDPMQTYNRIDDPRYANVLKTLSAQLRKGWHAALPKS